MTTPASGSEDIPLAQVKTLGISEILQVLALLASLATALFGHDFGITKNAQAIAQAAVILIPMGMAFARSIKHRGIAHANALVTAAQIEAAARALIAGQSTPAAPQSATVSQTTPGVNSTGGTTVTYTPVTPGPAVPVTALPGEVDLNDIPQDLEQATP